MDPASSPVDESRPAYSSRASTFFGSCSTTVPHCASALSSMPFRTYSVANRRRRVVTNGRLVLEEGHVVVVLVERDLSLQEVTERALLGSELRRLRGRGR